MRQQAHSFLRQGEREDAPGTGGFRFQLHHPTKAKYQVLCFNRGGQNSISSAQRKINRFLEITFFVSIREKKLRSCLVVWFFPIPASNKSEACVRKLNPVLLPGRQHQYTLQNNSSSIYWHCSISPWTQHSLPVITKARKDQKVQCKRKISKSWPDMLGKQQISTNWHCYISPWTQHSLPASSSHVSRALPFKPDHPVASDPAANFRFQKFRMSHVSYKLHSLATTIKKVINNTTAK